MEFTQHALTRKNQRNFSDESIEIILSHGRISHAPGGAIKVFFGRKESDQVVCDLKRTIQILEKTAGSSLIIAENKAITVYKAGKNKGLRRKINQRHNDIRPVQPIVLDPAQEYSEI